MGLIKAAASAIGSELHDQWKDFIKCEDLDSNTLMVKKTTPNGVITKDSAIMVSPGQIAVIFDSGKILDATAEEGIYTFDQSTSPSFFAGQFGAVFKDMWTRFVYGGAVNKQQYVFYMNAKEIIGNLFGTQTPIPYTDYSHAIPNQMTGEITPLRVNVRCHGKYTFKISDPALFMRQYAGTAEVVTKEEITEQMKSEVISVFQKVINGLGTKDNKISALELPSETDKITELLAENEYDKPIRERGISIVGFAVESVTLDDESNKKIDEYEHNANSMMQQGRVLNVMEAAASNPAGAGAGFMGVGMMNMATGGMNTAVMNNAFGGNNNQAAPQQGGYCPECGKPAGTGKFCPNCGNKLHD